MIRLRRVPLSESRGWVRKAVDLASSRYPAFVFGAGVSNLLPIFHFHEVTPQALAARLCYLAENGYRTVTSDALARWVLDGLHPGPRSVVLHFDDAWASLWTVAYPLLRKYGFSAVTFAIPGRIQDALSPRPTLEDATADPTSFDHSDVPLATWPELRQMHDSGVIDVQSHTFSHAMVFCSAQPEGFVTPLFARRSHLSRPIVSNGAPLEFLSTDNLGAPLFPARSRMSDGQRYFPPVDLHLRCQEWVAARGGSSFFQRPGWQGELYALLKNRSGHFETESERQRAIQFELDESRRLLNERLDTNTVQHACFPWTVAGQSALQSLQKAGYQTAVSNRWFGLRAARHGDPQYQLMRLSNHFIFHLPGKGRRYFLFS